MTTLPRLSDDFLVDLREVAQAAHRGLRNFGRSHRRHHQIKTEGRLLATFVDLDEARYAVATSPDVVLALLAMVDGLRADLAAARAEPLPAGTYRPPAWALELLADDLIGRAFEGSGEHAL
jgi:hypothetical protein